MSSAAVRDYFRSPAELVLCDRLLSLGVEEWHVGIVTHNSGMQSNHFPHGVSYRALPHLLAALRVHRDDAIVGALGPTVCESLWTWAQWPITREQWAGFQGAGSRFPEGPSRCWWPILGDTIEEARRMKRALERYAEANAPNRPEWYRGTHYNFRGCWRELSPKGGRWPRSSLLDTKRWPLLFGASRQGFEDMRAYRAGEEG